MKIRINNHTIDSSRITHLTKVASDVFMIYLIGGGSIDILNDVTGKMHDMLVDLRWSDVGHNPETVDLNTLKK